MRVLQDRSVNSEVFFKMIHGGDVCTSGGDVDCGDADRGDADRADDVSGCKVIRRSLSI